MAELMVTGKHALEGKIRISGAKNAVLPQMAATLLTSEKVTLKNVPNITDVADMISTLEAYGAKVNWDKNKRTLKIQAASLTSSLPSTNAGRNIRASFLVFGPLLARTRNAEVYLPEGCQIQEGGRKVDFHIQAMEDMKATLIEESKRFISMTAKDGLKPGRITFKNSSVGATECAMMAASLVEGETVIRNAAIEPEIYDLAEMLGNMGAEITIDVDVEIIEEVTEFGIDVEIEKWNVITISGRKSLRGVEHRVMPDRIEFGTYAIAAAITNGTILLEVEKDKKEDMLKAIREPLKDAGVKIEDHPSGVEISLEDGIISPVDIKTGPYPAFPTDLLPQWVTFMTQAQPTRRKEYTTIKDQIYNKRFNYVGSLEEMGADIRKISQEEYPEYHIYGTKLKRARVEAPDLRGGAALVLAGLVADGSTVVKKYDNIQRGYQDMPGKLNQCGAQLKVLEEPRRGFHGGSAF